jgi:hypothetical protein
MADKGLVAAPKAGGARVVKRAWCSAVPVCTIAAKSSSRAAFDSRSAFSDSARTLAALLMLMGMRTLARRCSDSGRRNKRSKGGRRGGGGAGADEYDSDAEADGFLGGGSRA